MAKIKLSDPKNHDKVMAALREVKAENRGFHVIPSRNRWVVVSDPSARARKIFDDKDGAIEHAKQLARANHLKMIVHGKDGSVEQEEKYR